MTRKTLFRILWVLIAFSLGFMMIKASKEFELANESDGELLDHTMKYVIYLFIGIGSIGIGLTKSLILIRDLAKSKNE